jgi:hypothetical protein
MNEADSTSEVTREQLEMGDWAQEGYFLTLVVPERHLVSGRFLAGGDE